GRVAAVQAHILRAGRRLEPGGRQLDPELRHLAHTYPVDRWTRDRTYRAAVRLFAGRGNVVGLSGSGEAAAGSSRGRDGGVPVGVGSALRSCGVAACAGGGGGGGASGGVACGAAGADGRDAAAAPLSG